MHKDTKEAATIPAEVMETFTMLYPKVKDVDWSGAGKYFEASFLPNERTPFLMFDLRGILMIVKSKIDRTELPAPVTTIVREQYPDTIYEWAN